MISNPCNPFLKQMWKGITLWEKWMWKEGTPNISQRWRAWTSRMRTRTGKCTQTGLTLSGHFHRLSSKRWDENETKQLYEQDGHVKHGNSTVDDLSVVFTLVWPAISLSHSVSQPVSQSLSQPLCPWWQITGMALRSASMTLCLMDQGYRLTKIKPDVDPIGDHCKQAPASLTHTFWLCPVLIPFCRSVFASFSKAFGLTIDPCLAT